MMVYLIFFLLLTRSDMIITHLLTVQIEKSKYNKYNYNVREIWSIRVVKKGNRGAAFIH